MTLEEQVELLIAENRAKDEHIELLQQKLDYVLHQLHNPRSEKFDPNQLTLLDDESKKAAASSDNTSAPEEANADDADDGKKKVKKRAATQRKNRIKSLKVERIRPKYRHKTERHRAPLLAPAPSSADSPPPHSSPTFSSVNTATTSRSIGSKKSSNAARSKSQMTFS